ncbi:MAG: hypothetical protein V4724_01095 [Pseudomonadota bacterium]
MSSSPFSIPSINDASQHPPQISAADGTRTWITRASNFVVATALCRAGAVIDGEHLPDESMLLLPDTGARVEIGGESFDILPDSLVILPPGRVRIVAQGDGTIVRICSHLATELMVLAGNRADFSNPRPEVAPLKPWPAPPGGYKVRIYHLPELTPPGERMRIFRSTNLMVNVVVETFAPRDVRTLSPHKHDDLEQATLCVRGQFIHHLRTPWTPDLHHWRDDLHAEVGSPSVTVIPAGVIHTSRSTTIDGGALLVDVFAPPRADFALHPTWGRNNDDYPLPPELRGA